MGLVYGLLNCLRLPKITKKERIHNNITLEVGGVLSSQAAGPSTQSNRILLAVAQELASFFPPIQANPDGEKSLWGRRQKEGEKKKKRWKRNRKGFQADRQDSRRTSYSYSYI